MQPASFQATRWVSERIWTKRVLVYIFGAMGGTVAVFLMVHLGLSPWWLLFLGGVLGLVFWLNWRGRRTRAALWLLWALTTGWPLGLLFLYRTQAPRETLSIIVHTTGLPLALLALYLPWPRNVLVSTLQAVAMLAGIAWWVPRANLPALATMYAFFLSLNLVGALWDYLLRQTQQLGDLYQRLEEQREFLQAVIEAIQNPFYVIDVDTYHIVLANAAARRYGIRAGRQAPMTCYQLTHLRDTPCDGAEHPCPLQHVRQHHEPVVVEHIHYRPDGTPYPVEVHAYPVRDRQGRLRYMVEYSIDISERKQAEERLRLFRRASEFSAHGIVITDADGVIQYVNPAFTRLTGYTPEEAIGQTPRILKSGKHDREFYRRFWATIKAGNVWSGVMINRRKDGTLYYEEQTVAPVFDEDGQRITHFVAIKQDVTRRIELERALKEANRFKTRLLGSLGHDIRIPLQIIFNMSEWLLESPRLTEDERDLVRQIVLATAQMQDFAEGLLAYARLDEKDLQLNLRAFPLRSLVQRLEGLYRFIARQKGLTFHIEAPEDLETVYGDETWLARAIGNLVSNAIRYTPPGGRVQVRFWQPDAHTWAVTVEDNGPGIPREEQERLFAPFTTGPHQDAASMGLGLYIVKSVVEAHRGRVEVDSEPGRGTRITLCFPLTCEPAA